MQLTLLYLLVFTGSAAGLLAFVYSQSRDFMRQQTGETIAAEITGLEEQYQTRGLTGLAQIITRRARLPEQDRDSIYLLVDLNGRLLAGNISAWPLTTLGADGRLSFELDLVSEETGKSRSVRAIGLSFQIKDVAKLLVGRIIEERLKLEERLWSVIMQGGGVMLLVAVVGGFLLSRWTIGRLETVNRTAAQIMAGDFSQRIATKGGGDEFDELATNLNAMLARIDRLLTGMREVTDNIAHDLRTPLQRMRIRLEVALQEGPSDPAVRELIETTIADAEGLIRTFNALLSIARADAGERRAEWERVDLAELAGEVQELYEPLAEDRSIALKLEVAEAVSVAGSRELLAQAVGNLVDNAIKFSPVGSEVRIRCCRDKGPAIDVIDHGPGIPANRRDNALERFVRLEADRATPGNGLGLSLARAVARLHDATLRLDDTDPPPGLHVTLSFPEAANDPTSRDGFGSRDREGKKAVDQA